MKIGSPAHKELFCSSFINSHIEYEPEQLPWPELDAADLNRLRQIPFWEEALNTELAAGAKIAAYLPMISDPQVQEAVALQGREEARHGRLFRFLIEHYGIETCGRAPNDVSAAVEAEFVKFGYGECLDSFLGFGMYQIARQSGFLPEPMFNIFDLLLQEEARHIVFFVNWIAYLQATRGRGNRILRSATSLWHYSRAIQGLVELASGMAADEDENDFAATEASALLEDFSVKQLLAECLAENNRRMSGFDSRLLQPKLLPRMARVALTCLQLLPEQKSPAQAKIAS